MSGAILVQVDDPTWTASFATLANDAEVAAKAARRAGPGDSQDARRYSELAGLIELRALIYAHRHPERVGLADGPVPWISPDGSGHSWASLATGGTVFIGDPNTPVQATAPLARPLVDPYLPPPLTPVARSQLNSMTAAQSRLRRAAAGAPLIAANFSPDDLADGLAVLARTGDRSPGLMRVLYGDGSEAAPFPIRSLDFEPVAIGERLVVKLALLSGRHPQLDRTIHGAWFRNNELSGAATTSADTDAIAYQLSCAQLAALAADGRSIWVDLYLTGMEPAIVGLFRALVEHLVRDPSSVILQSHFYRGPDSPYAEGTVWSHR